MDGTGPVLSRRNAICGLLAALAAPGALAACSSDSAAPAAPVSSGPAATVGPAPSTSLAALADVPVGGGTIVDGPDGPLLLVRETEGTVTGYDARCPHAGTTVSPPADGTIVCPNHGSQFDPATGAVTLGPARSGLLPVAVTVTGDQVALA